MSVTDERHRGEGHAVAEFDEIAGGGALLLAEPADLRRRSLGQIGQCAQSRGFRHAPSVGARAASGWRLVSGAASLYGTPLMPGCCPGCTPEAGGAVFP